MRRRALRIAAAVAFMSAAGVACTSAAAIVFDEPHARFGDRYQGSSIEHRFSFTNDGDAPVTVTDTVVVDRTGSVEVSPRTVAPGARGVAIVTQPLDNQLGNTAFRYALISDEPGSDRYRFTLSGFVESAYDPEAPSIDFGLVDRDRGATAEVEVASREVAALEARPAGDLPGGLTLEALGPAGDTGQALRFRVRLPPGSAPGLIAGSFELETNVAHQPRVEVYFRANVVGDVVPSENPLQLGITRIGDVLSKEVLLQSSSGRPFEVEGVDDSSGLLTVTVEPCADPGAACRRLLLGYAAEAPLNLIGKLHVRLSGDADPITLNYRGMVVSRDTVIKTIEAPR